MNTILNQLKNKPINTSQNEIGFKVNIMKNNETSNINKKTNIKIIKELTDDGQKAIDFLNRINEYKMNNIGVKPKQKKNIKHVKFEEPNMDDDQEKEQMETTLSTTIKKTPTSRRTYTQKQTNLLNTINQINTGSTYTEINNDIIVGNKTLGDRIPENPEFTVKIPNYIMNNREDFVNFINDILFKEYKDIITEDDEENKITCENLTSGSSKAGLMIHQLIIRDYLNLYTPYRGLLIFHGLGAGKTCGSIAIAEGMKTFKKVIVMLPASLERNYMEEIKKCGDPIFKKNQYWEWISVEEQSQELINNLSAVLYLSPEEIRKKGGVWITDITKPSNIGDLTEEDFKSLNKQLDLMISKKYQFIRYNGLRKAKFKEMTQDYTLNIFDNKVVIIDEAHNLISRIVNRISKVKKSNLSSTRTKELDDVLALRIYHMLMSAENCKIVLLSGTPIINYPNEIGILFNILRGYIKSWKFTLNPSSGESTIINEKILREQVFGENKIVDYVQYSPNLKELTITRNPFGFSNVIERGRYLGVTDIPNEETSTQQRSFQELSDDEFKENIIRILNKNRIKANFISMTYNLALPDTLDEFISNFINTDDPNDSGKVKNIKKFQRRILGLTSYFRSAQEELMPRYDKKINRKVVRIPMSDYQFNIYSKYRKEERERENEISRNKGGNETSGANLFKMQSSTYRIMSRLSCNIVLPDRPNPTDFSKKKTKTIIEENTEQKIQNEETKETKETKETNDNQEENATVTKKIKKVKKITVIDENDDDKSNLKETNMEEKTMENNQDGEIMSEIKKILNEDYSKIDNLKKEKIINTIEDFENNVINKKKMNLTPEIKQKLLLIIKKYIYEINKNRTESSFIDYYKETIKKSKTKTSETKETTGGANDIYKNDFLNLFGGVKNNNFDDYENENENDDEVYDDSTMFDMSDIDDADLILPTENSVEDAINEMTNANYSNKIEEFIENLKNNPEPFLKIEEQPNGLNEPRFLMNYSPKYVEIIKNITNENHIGLHLLYSQFRNMEGLGIFSLALDVNGFNRFKLIKNSEGVFEISPETMNLIDPENNKFLYAMYTGEESSEERELIRNIYNGDWNDVPQNIKQQLLEKSENNNFGQIIKLLMITSAGAEGINLRNTRYVHIMEPYWHPVRVEQVIGRAKRICSHKNLPEELRTVEVFIYICYVTKKQLDSKYGGEISRLDDSLSSDEKLLQISNTKEIISEKLLKAIKETSIDCATYSKTNSKEGLTCLTFGRNNPNNFTYVPNYQNQPEDTTSMLNEVEKISTRKILKLKNGKEFQIDVATNELYNPGEFESIGKLEETYDANGTKKTTIKMYKTNR